MTDITISSASFDALADYDPYSERNISAIRFLEDKCRLSADGKEILSTYDLCKWLQAIHDAAFELSAKDPQHEELGISKTLLLDNVLSVGDSAFKNTYVISACMPKVQCISANAFRNTDIIEIDFPMLSALGTDAFTDCFQLTSVSLPGIASDSQLVSRFTNCSCIQSISLPGLTSFSTDGKIPKMLRQLSSENEMTVSFPNGSGEFVSNWGYSSANLNYFYNYAQKTIDLRLDNVQSIQPAAPEASAMNTNRGIYSCLPFRLKSFYAPKLSAASLLFGFYAGPDILDLPAVVSAEHICNCDAFNTEVMKLDNCLTLTNRLSVDKSSGKKRFRFPSEHLLSCITPKVQLIEDGFFLNCQDLAYLDVSDETSPYSKKANPISKSSYGIPLKTTIKYKDGVDRIGTLILNRSYVTEKTVLTGDLSVSVEKTGKYSFATTLHVFGDTTCVDGTQKTAIHNYDISSIEDTSSTVSSVISSCAFAHFTEAEGVQLIDSPAMQIQDVSMNSLASIGDDAFLNATTLTACIAPNVLSIGEYAFDGCRDLQILDIHNSKYSADEQDADYVVNYLQDWGIHSARLNNDLSIVCKDGVHIVNHS